MFSIVIFFVPFCGPVQCEPWSHHGTYRKYDQAYPVDNSKRQPPRAQRMALDRPRAAGPLPYNEIERANPAKIDPPFAPRAVTGRA